MAIEEEIITTTEGNEIIEEMTKEDTMLLMKTLSMINESILHLLVHFHAFQIAV
jgi:hypothetical protein